MPRMALTIALLLFQSALAQEAPSGRHAPTTAPSHPEKLAEGVSDFWLMNQGKTLVYWTRQGDVWRLDSDSKEPRKILAGVATDVREPLGDAHLAVQVGESLAVLDINSGKITPVLRGLNASSLVYSDPGNEWCIVNGSRDGEKPKLEYCRIAFKTMQAKKVFESDGDSDSVDNVVDDGRTLVSQIDQSEEKVTYRRVDLESLKVTSQTAPRYAPEPGITGGWTCPDGKTRVIIDSGKLCAEVDRKRRQIDLPPGRIQAEPNLSHKPGYLAVSVLSDTDKDGKVSREDGDIVQIYLLDLKTLKTTLVADSKQENIERDWSDDGRYYFWSRVEKKYCLYVFDTCTAAASKVVESEDFITPFQMLADGRLTVNVLKRDGRAEIRLVGLPGGSDQVTLLGFAPPASAVLGSTIFYLGDTDQKDKDTLYRLPIPPPVSAKR